MSLDNLLTAADQAAEALLAEARRCDNSECALADRVKAFQAATAYIEGRSKPPPAPPKPAGRPKKGGGINGIRRDFHDGFGDHSGSGRGGDA
jgi:hypothetical protein